MEYKDTNKLYEEFQEARAVPHQKKITPKFPFKTNRKALPKKKQISNIFLFFVKLAISN